MKPSSSTSGIENIPPIFPIYENLIALIDENINQFFQFKIDYESENKDLIVKNMGLKKEDDITNAFDSFLNIEIPKNENNFLFKFQANTIESTTSTDIGVISVTNNKYRCLCFIEAKRLPTPTYSGSQPTEYVCYKNVTKKGGIERFKTGDHGGKEKFPFSIMVGYIESENSKHWFSQINNWISEEIKISSNSEITWNEEDKLKVDHNFKQSKIGKYNSIHSKKDFTKIKLVHYLIELN